MCRGSGFRQLSSNNNIATKTFPAQKATSVKFCTPHLVPLPGQDPVYSKQQETGAPEAHSAASTFSGLWPGQRAQGRCPASGLPDPSQGQASWDAAQPTHHGDSAAVAPPPVRLPRQWGWNAVSWANFKSWFPSPKNKLPTPKHSQEPMGTQRGLHPGGIGDAR